MAMAGRTAPSLLVQVGDLLAATLLDLTLARKLGQVRPLLGGVAIGLLAGGVGTVPGDGLVVEIRRVPAQLGGQFSTQTLVVVASGRLLVLRSRCSGPTQDAGGDTTNHAER